MKRIIKIKQRCSSVILFARDTRGLILTVKRRTVVFYRYSSVTQANLLFFFLHHKFTGQSWLRYTRQNRYHKQTFFTSCLLWSESAFAWGECYSYPFWPPSSLRKNKFSSSDWVNDFLCVLLRLRDGAVAFLTWDTVMPHFLASSSLASSLGYGLDRCE